MVTGSDMNLLVSSHEFTWRPLTCDILAVVITELAVLISGFRVPPAQKTLVVVRCEGARISFL